ncbi:MAG: nicotinate-nucleotide diphosphorylase (carboxylating) [Sulfurimonas sp. RIFOXYD12_FULL_33_39]|uniref:carboxylating nicotinate-nucleotide diphosphorylase n=1 Tax=unclassified Sulfurimonas TaxID=2623549 RepID=UPI0008D0E781|nr:MULTISPECIES: carboxylating nicotinate-nucleotide diphosphorylase [unclassified Sulfurimonas]OHE07066.1 MAG: nicotinate-nucleotide diphosphorylase (carboxylating) [Sulfurimonas sp. RIFCSPLOWO2_12_FULL_34_6]OHE10663.1 MAG: nicotinate-nucleotide diphosphorylase (carboxylating) [Sulfurimonas sp. RIFOXYD12_FULL_33_39]OHE13176.1 MAG: nicotinate-nucleotide diphosphorylase (carboxylating) [Sulfurimonas sp. RIFOXYD2_FULL_34_21]DAB27482.1 MAG TPA: nicotinate-nucleotide diphosphorylase (carboxylating)
MMEEFIKAALAEDVGRGDLYALVEPSVSASARIITKSDGVIAGVEYINVLAKLEDFEISWNLHDGEEFLKGDVLANISGTSHVILKIERTLLNMLLHASSIATLTRKYVDIIRPYGTKLLDTRKTRPQLRVFEKYATRCGGAVNHRMGLDDSLMLKDTHLKTIENLKEYIKKARKKIPFTTKIEVEAETFHIAKEAFASGADIVMCDNMTPDEIVEVVKYRDDNFSHVLLEASGNISLETIESYAKTGVDAISSGSLIHQANWIDLSMKID